MNKRIEAIVFTVAPFSDGGFQVLGIGSAPDAQDELILVSQKMYAAGLRAWAKDFRMLADSFDRMAGTNENDQ